MSSIAAGANSERTNRWLLIGAAVLAIVTGILVFLALANFGGSSSNKSTTQAVSGDAKVLVAKQTIQPNTKVTADMFETSTVARAALVDGAVTDPAQVLGKVARTIVLKGEQLTTNRIGTVDGKAEPGFRDTIPNGRRAVSVKVTEETSVAGLLVPGDRVDIIGTFTEKQGQNQNQNQNQTVRVETVLQNVEVLAFAQKSLDALPSLDAQGTPIATDSSAGSLGQRPTNTSPNKSAGTATLSLSPDEVQTIVAAEAKGDLTLALRAPADAAATPIAATRIDDNGFVIPTRP
jgi:pilus assembly protein CpaB